MTHKKTLFPLTQSELDLLSLCVEYTASHVCASDEMKQLFEKVKFYSLKAKNEERVRKNSVPRKKKVTTSAVPSSVLQQLENFSTTPKRTYKKKGGAK